MDQLKTGGSYNDENIALTVKNNSVPQTIQNQLNTSTVLKKDRSLIFYSPYHHKAALSMINTKGQDLVKRSRANCTYSESPRYAAQNNDYFNYCRFAQSWNEGDPAKQRVRGRSIKSNKSCYKINTGQAKASKFAIPPKAKNLYKKFFQNNHVPSFIKKSKQEQQQIEKQERKERNNGRKGSLIRSTILEPLEGASENPHEDSNPDQTIIFYGDQSMKQEANIKIQEQLQVPITDMAFQFKIQPSPSPNKDQLPSLMPPLKIDKRKISIQNYTEKLEFANDKISAEQLRKFPKLSDFQLGQLLGKGAYGSVRVARHKQTGFFLALKNYLLKNVQQRKQKFIECMRLQMTLNHPNIASLYGFFVEENEVYLMMELCVDVDLSSQLKTIRKVPSDMQQVIKGTVLGLQYMHANKVLHRDIKLENVLMCHNMPKITDFDLAVYIQNPSESRRTFCGSPAYFSPEMLSNYCYNSKADVWSLGILCYEIICGYSPFQTTNYHQTMENIVNQNPKDYPPDISEEGKNFISIMLVKDPQQRAGWRQLLNHPYLAN